MFWTGAAAVLLWLLSCEIALRFVSQEMVQTVVEEYLLKAVNQAVSQEMAEEPREYAVLTRNAEGEVSDFSADGQALNALRAGVLERLETSLHTKTTAGVPLGSLMPLGLFNGRGPRVPVRLSLLGSGAVSFETQFRSGGVNQTCCTLTMQVDAQAYSPSRRFETAAQVHVETVLAQTVVVGSVPEGSMLYRSNH